MTDGHKHTIYRHELMNPREAPWEYRAKEMPPERQKPIWVRLKDGRWMRLEQAGGDVLGGEIIHWRSFKLMMDGEQARYRKLETEFKGSLLVSGFGALLIVGSLIAINRELVPWSGIVVPLISVGSILLGIGLRDAVLKFHQLQLIPVYDPGPEIVVNLKAEAAKKNPYGTSEREDPQDIPGRFKKKPWE